MLGNFGDDGSVFVLNEEYGKLQPDDHLSDIWIPHCIGVWQQGVMEEKTTVLYGAGESGKLSMLAVLEPDMAEKMVERLTENPLERYHLSGVVLVENPGGRTEIRDIPVVAELEDAAQYVCREWIDSVFISSKGVTSELREFVQFVALCLYQHTENEIMRVKASLLEEADGNGKAKPRKLKEQEKKLWKMLDSRSIVRILNWFDVYDKVDISVKLRLRRWSEPTVSYERIFLERLGVIP